MPAHRPTSYEQTKAARAAIDGAAALVRRTDEGQLRLLEARVALVDRVGPDVSDRTDTPATVRSRCLAAGLSEERIAGYVERRLLLVDGRVVEDVDATITPGSRIVIAGNVTCSRHTDG